MPRTSAPYPTLACLLLGLSASAPALAQQPGPPAQPTPPGAVAPPPPGVAPPAPPGAAPPTAPPALPPAAQPPPGPPGAQPPPGQPPPPGYGQPPPPGYGQPPPPGYGQPPPPGYGQPPPPGYGQPPPGGWTADAQQAGASDEPATKPQPGVSAKGVPLAQRGGLVLEVASMRESDENDAALTVMGITARLPVADRTFVDLRMPLGFGAAGNPTAGMRHIARVSDNVWITAGGLFGFPVAPYRERLFEAFAASRAYWNLYDFYPEAVPIAGLFGLEAHASGFLIFRLEVDPMFYIPLDAQDDPQLTIQNAIELQFGHRIGGGLRLQGVWLTTFDNDDVYQAALEPFFTVEHDVLFGRAGLVMPLDEELGPPFETFWGFHLSAGIRVD